MYEVDALYRLVRLRGHRVREVMRPGMPAPESLGRAVDVDAPLDDDVLTALQEVPDHRVPVQNGGEIIGTLWLEDVAHLVASTGPVDAGVDQSP